MNITININEVHIHIEKEPCCKHDSNKMVEEIMSGINKAIKDFYDNHIPLEQG